MITKISSSLFRLFLLAIVLVPPHARAWGKRGHQVVAETAALLVSAEPDGGFLRVHSFDLGYYANAPDFAWKRNSTYKLEKPQHFMDLEIFEREFAKHPEIENPFALSRQEFEAKFPAVTRDAGRSFWRIREFYDQLGGLTVHLRDMKEKSGEARQLVQEDWLVKAGTMAHYLGDLCMPLHVSENYDGQATNQKGLHSFFEDIMVNQLYPKISAEVNAEAAKQWPAFTRKNRDKTVLQLMLDLSEKSKAEIPNMLAIDKKMGRSNLKKAAEAYSSLIRRQLVVGSLTLAELLRRQIVWEFDEGKFFYITGDPAYVMPGSTEVVVTKVASSGSK